MTSRPRRVVEIQETLLNLIRERLIDSRIYIHFTGDKSVSEKIQREGFRYSESFDKTTAEISQSKVDIIYKYQLYKDYGKFMIVICIPQFLIERIELKKIDTSHDSLYNLGLSEYNPEGELDYTLPAKYIYAYIDLEKNIVYKNEFYLNE